MTKDIYVFTIEQLELILDKAYIYGRIKTLEELDAGKQFI